MRTWKPTPRRKRSASQVWHTVALAAVTVVAAVYVAAFLLAVMVEYRIRALSADIDRLRAECMMEVSVKDLKSMVQEWRRQDAEDYRGLLPPLYGTERLR